MKKLIITLLLLMITSISILADQAAYITQAQAQKAAAFLKDKTQIRHYCIPCDDKGDRVVTEGLSPVSVFVVRDGRFVPVHD